MIPMADNLNHSYETMSHNLINLPLHLKPESNLLYSTPSKMINNFSTLYNHLKVAPDEGSEVIITGNYDDNVYAENENKISVL